MSTYRFVSKAVIAVFILIVLFAPTTDAWARSSFALGDGEFSLVAAKQLVERIRPLSAGEPEPDQRSRRDFPLHLPMPIWP